MNITISIIIPAYCNRNILQRCLNSINLQTYQHKLIEVIIIDDCSPDKLTLIVDEFKLNNNGFQKILYLRNEKNAGRAITRNRGISHATGNVIFFLDVDNILESNCCSNLIKYFQTTDKNLAVRCNVRSSNESITNSSYARFFNSRYLGQRKASEVARINFDSLPSKYFATDAVAVLKSDLLSVGVFDTVFSEYGCEDEDMGIRLINNGAVFKLGVDCHVIDSDTPTIRRACERMVVYARYSVRKLLLKHPTYASHTLLSAIELPISELKFRDIIKRILIKLIVVYPFASLILNMLDRYDGQKIPMSGFFYKYVLIAHYMRGIQQR